MCRLEVYPDIDLEYKAVIHSQSPASEVQCETPDTTSAMRSIIMCEGNQLSMPLERTGMAVNSGDARSLSHLFFGMPRQLAGGATYSVMAQPMMWLLRAQGALYFVNNSDYLLGAVDLFIAVGYSDCDSSDLLGCIVEGHTGPIDAWEVRLASTSGSISAGVPWPCMEIELLMQRTERKIRLVTEAVDECLPEFPLLYASFELAEKVRYVYSS